MGQASAAQSQLGPRLRALILISLKPDLVQILSSQTVLLERSFKCSAVDIIDHNNSRSLLLCTPASALHTFASQSEHFRLLHMTQSTIRVANCTLTQSAMPHLLELNT